VLSLRAKLFLHIQQMPLAFFTRTQTGALVSRLNTDVQGARTAFTDLLSNGIGNLITVILMMSAMFVLSWRIALAALVLLPLFVLPARFWGRKLQAITRETFDLVSAMNSLMVERFNVAGALLAKLFGNSQQEGAMFEAKAVRVSAISVKQALYGGRLFVTVLLLMATLSTALAYGWGGVLVVRHELDLGTVVALVSYLARLYAPLLGLSNIQVSLMTALVSFERVFEVLDLPPMLGEKPGAVPIPAGPAEVSFEHVSFRYPSAAEVSLASLESIAVPDKRTPGTVLNDVDFVVEPGQLVALVGPSGGGKTTITHLIPRLYDVLSGAIKIAGIDVRDARLDSLQQRIGIVTQDAHLFHDTIRANLYAKPDATQAQMREALGAAQILALVDSLPDGLDTMVGERGYRFSGGEKQRLAIARLLLKAPDIVVLDEATAHLDSESEAAIQRALETALAGRTSIVIAHRLSTILKADQILVVQNGRIVQRGTHTELLKLQGLYAELYQRQPSVPVMKMNCGRSD
jgi:ATP-binding cassette subfamily B protein